VQSEKAIQVRRTYPVCKGVRGQLSQGPIHRSKALTVLHPLQHRSEQLARIAREKMGGARKRFSSTVGATTIGRDEFYRGWAEDAARTPPFKGHAMVLPKAV
jgi:hypothetical protein